MDSGDHAQGPVSSRRVDNLKIASLLSTTRAPTSASILNVAVAQCIKACLAGRYAAGMMRRYFGRYDECCVIVEATPHSEAVPSPWADCSLFSRSCLSYQASASLFVGFLHVHPYLSSAVTSDGPVIV